MIATTMTKKGQVTIPKEIRDILGLKEHDKIVFGLKDGEITMKPIRGSVLDLRGSVKPKQRPEDFNQVRAETMRARAKKAVKEVKGG
jgi:antitoxin PrlF